MSETNLKLAKAKFGAEAILTIVETVDLAAIYRDAGRTDEAIRIFEQLLPLFRKVLGPEGTHSVMNNLAMSYRDAGRTGDQIRMLEELVKLDPKVPNSGNLRSFGDMNLLGGAYLTAGRWAEAEPLLREVLKSREAKQPDAWNTFNSRSLLGGSLLGQKKYAEAEPLIVSGYEGMKARESKIPAPNKPRLAEAGERVVTLYEAWGKPAKAAEWRAKLGIATTELPRDVFVRPR